MFGSLKRTGNENSQPGPSNEVPTVEDCVPTKLSDLNFDCLLKILMPLSKTDLMTLIVCSDIFLDAARYIFERKFSKEIFHISNNPLLNEQGQSQTIKYLRAFGDIILSLLLEYDEDFRQFDRSIECAIIENCRTTLKRITFANAMGNAMIGITEPFEQIREVKFVSSKFGELIANFSKWFPAAHSLRLESQIRQTSEQRQLIERHHPALRNFGILNVMTPDLCADTIQGRINDHNLTTFIQLNPQLTSLSIICDKPKHIDGIIFNGALISAIEEKLENLESLIIFFTNSTTYNLRKIHCKKLKILIIRTPNTRTAVTFPISFDTIDILIFHCASVEPNEFRAFLDRCKNVKRLYMVTVAFWIIQNFDAFSRIPTLEELRFPISIRDLVLLTQNVGDFLRKCKTLERLVVFFNREPIENESMILEQFKMIDGFNGPLPKWRAKIITTAARTLMSRTLLIFRMRSEMQPLH